jgi:pyruvate, water dikinase
MAVVFQRIKSWMERTLTPDQVVQRRFALFQALLHNDRACLRLITKLEEICHRPIPTDWSRIALLVRSLSITMTRMVHCLQEMQPGAYAGLMESQARIFDQLREMLPRPAVEADPPYALPLEKGGEHPELLGGKASGLVRILRETKIPVQPGVVVTTSAFNAYLRDNRLGSVIAGSLRTLNLRSPVRLQAVADRLQTAIMSGTVPGDVRASLLAAMEQVAGTNRSTRWAVRSSAHAEDGGGVSFAGQYTTVQNVGREDIFSAYKTVLASKYSTQALTYRLHYGLEDNQVPMAVLIQPMIESHTSGVMYTLDPLDFCRGGCLVITATRGLGTHLVAGSTVPDIVLVSRQNPEHFLAKQPAGKHTPNQSPESRRDHQNLLCLDDASAITLARWGLALEALAGTPQDVEWTQDREGNLFVLQSRPIRVPEAETAEAPALEPSRDTPPPADHADAILDVGTPASVGIATGRVHHLAGETELDRVPAEVILVTQGIPPSLVRLAHKVRAVLAKHGSKASHFASVAREFGLPLVVGLGDLADTLQQGQTVTVDAYRGVVYDGPVQALITWQERQRARPPIPFQKKIAPLMELISPLTLTDPASAGFVPGNCRTCNDLVRFVHEKGTQEMFSLVDAKGGGLRRARPLQTDIPIVMQVLDLGHGLTAAAGKHERVRPEHFQSAPMQAVWAGLSDRDITWSEGLLHMDWERFDRISGGIFNPKSAAQLASYALLAENYAHLLLRFGYHFAVIDGLSGQRSDENYIQFRFKGGGGIPEKRYWRLAMINKVLTHFGFLVKIQEDMLEAKCKRLDYEANQLRLRVLGYLLGYTPLLDMALESEGDALQVADRLLKKWI